MANRLIRKLAIVLSAGALTLGLASFGAGSANAAQYAYQGWPGTALIAAQAKCKLDTRGNLIVTGSSPRVWARDANRGLHNDVANVRFAGALEVNGRIVNVTPWSEWRQVWDNESVVWPTGAEMQWGQKNNSLRLGYQVEFHNVRGGWMGASFVLFDSYNYFNNYNIGPIGPIAACRTI